MSGIDASTRMVGVWKLWEFVVGALAIVTMLIAAFVLLKSELIGALLMLLGLVSINAIWLALYRTRAERTAEYKRRRAMA